MKISLDRIQEIYGESAIYEIKDHLDDVLNNMQYLVSKGFKDVYFILQTNPYIFLYDEKTFKRKANDLFNKLGVEYIEKLEEDFSLWGDMND